MELTIKKASDLVKDALEASNRIKPARSVKLSVYGKSDPEQAINEASTKLSTDIQDTIELVEVSYGIKRLIGVANDSIGITDLLRKGALNEALEKKLATFSKIIEKNDITMYSIVELNLDAVKERIQITRDRIQNSERPGGIEDHFSVSCVSKELASKIEDDVRAVRRQKLLISDQIAALNSNNKIEIPDTFVKVLEKHKLI